MRKLSSHRSHNPTIRVLLQAGSCSLLFLFFLAPAKIKQSQWTHAAATKEARRTWVEDTLKDLSLEEKVGQMLQVRYYLDYKSFDSPEYNLIRRELQEYHIGSAVCGMHFDNSGPIRSSALEAAKVANQLQTDAKLPLLLAADLERGVASRLHDVPAFPWPMAFGAANDPDKVERFGAATAREARAIGIQWALAPVADVNNNPANPIINTRSFGEDPQQVGFFVNAFVRGAHRNGLLVTAKHFPGNGDTITDSHLGVATIRGDMDHLQKVELPPFKEAINAGVDSIMLAHAIVPALEPDPERITTISSRVVKDVLRDQLKFTGVILTDALEMRGLTRLYDPRKGSPTARAAVDAVKAGNDVIMVPADLDGAFHAIVNAVRSGDITEARIDQSVQRVLEMKASVGLNKNRFVDLKQASSLTSEPPDMEFAQSVADDAVTLVRDDGKMLPLQRFDSRTQDGSAPTPSSQAERRLLVILLAESFETENGHELVSAIKNRRPNAEIFYFDGRFSTGLEPRVLSAANDAKEVVIAAYVILRSARQIELNGKYVTYFGLAGPSGKLLSQLLEIAPEKTVVLSLGSPYLIESHPEIKTYVCTYAMASTSEISAVKALFGELQNHAKLPVTLPGIAPRGFSLPWPTQERRDKQSSATTP
ncbi:MAG TPA: glycoside hydrolase family 3 N-terminal domain-containing protein [Candidatus Acidoferrum sp.]|nr:glycoside hydrolase family 3 N-terminal domain-containing protein [Candidatus Acidoferrum sp.]